MTIGLEQAVYVTMEGQTQEVCASVTSGSISVGSTFRVGYGSLTGTGKTYNEREQCHIKYLACILGT